MDIEKMAEKIAESHHPNQKDFLNNGLITQSTLILLGYSYHKSGMYYCPPSPAHGGTYRIEFKATCFEGNKAISGTEEWRAFLTNDTCSTIRRFRTLGELNYFHKGMCGEWLF